jgi:hypothetical protein
MIVVVIMFVFFARNLFWAIGSGVAGVMMQVLTFSAPLLVGGGRRPFMTCCSTDRSAY